jgi:hypothetical protein
VGALDALGARIVEVAKNAQTAAVDLSQEGYRRATIDLKFPHFMFLFD